VSRRSFPPGIRPYRPGDEERILEAMLAALERGEFEGVTRHDLGESVKRLPADPAMCAVAEENGHVVGWVIPRHDDLTVDLPWRRRGHGTRLVAAGREIARQHGLPWLRLWAPRHLPGPIAFLQANGFTYHSSMWLMRLPPEAPAASPRFPDDVVVRWFERGVDDEAYVELANDAFRDHPSPLTFSIDRVRHVHGLPDFDPSTILLLAPAAQPEHLVGFVRVQRYDDDGRRLGDIGPIGLREPWRGRGLGRDLLRWGIMDLRRRGAEDVYLSVEAENTGALGLYESAGFVRDVEWPHWVLPLSPAG
jgi:mycothiol synthase